MEVQGDKDIIEKYKMRQGNISLALHSYDAIFSDFDPRPFSERSVSDDFIYECKRAVRHKEGKFELRLLIPARLRNVKDEMFIRNRLKEYFKKHLHEKEKEIKSIKREGIRWFFIGSLILTFSTLLYEYKYLANSWLKFLVDFLFIISQPAGWFTFWEGLGKIFIVSREQLPDHDFYKKMENTDILFFDY